MIAVLQRGRKRHVTVLPALSFKDFKVLTTRLKYSFRNSKFTFISNATLSPAVQTLMFAVIN